MIRGTLPGGESTYGATRPARVSVRRAPHGRRDELHHLDNDADADPHHGDDEHRPGHRLPVEVVGREIEREHLPGPDGDREADDRGADLGERLEPRRVICQVDRVDDDVHDNREVDQRKGYRPHVPWRHS